MLNIVKNQDNGTLTIALEGRVDITTAPDLEKEIKDLDGVTELISTIVTALSFLPIIVILPPNSSSGNTVSRFTVNDS